MKVKYLLIILILSSTINLSTASNPYGVVYTYDAYYNDILLPGTEVAKPVLKIGEPFTVAINLTVYQKSEVSIKLREIEEGYFIIIDGPTSKMNIYRADVMERNSSLTYKWKVKPTEKWAGGTLPIDIVYQIDAFDTKKSLVRGSFTVAYPFISNEYYEGKISTPTTSEHSTSLKTTKPSESTPAFTAIGTLISVALALALFRR